MTSETVSVFDLSPSEKLQLVEDLWDDLAAEPDSIPVHPWQTRELERAEGEPVEPPGLGPVMG